MEISEKTLTGGFSGVKSRLAFDSEISLPNLTQADYNKMKIDQSFKAFKREDLKIGYKLKLDRENEYYYRRVIFKILKLDKNNEYGFTMTKPMFTYCIKEKTPCWTEFNLLLETVDLDDKIGHLFIFDIEFVFENSDPRQMMYNEIFPPVIDKHKRLDPNERPAFQLCEMYSETDDHIPKSYRNTKNRIQLYFQKMLLFFT